MDNLKGGLDGILEDIQDATDARGDMEDMTTDAKKKAVLAVVERQGVQLTSEPGI